MACSTVAKKNPLSEPVVLEVSKDGRAHYLVGTIHLPLDVEKMYPDLYRRLGESSVFVSEIDMRQLESGALEQVEDNESFYKDSTVGSLEKDLSPAAYKMAEDKLFYMTGSIFYSLKPLKVWQLLEERYVWTPQRQQTVSPEQLFANTFPNAVYRKDGKLYDQQLEDFAIQHGKKLVALEEIQNPILARCSQLGAIAEIEQLAYREKFNESSKYFDKAYDAAEDCSLKERNEVWMKKLNPILQSKEKAFIAVGMGHLGLGDETLLQILEKEGYSFKKLPPSR